MKILHTLTFDLLTNGVPPVVDAVQTDSNTRVIQATFWQGSEAVILDAGTAVSLACVKPDKTQCWYDTLPDGTKAATADGNSVSVTLAPEVMSCAGDVTACIVIHDSGGQISTFPFKIRVSRNPAAGSAISNSYYKVSTLEQINAVLDEMATAAGGAVRYDEEQGLTPKQQAQARENIGAAAVGEGGSGTGLTDTARALLISILRNGVFTSDQSANITALENALASNGGEEPDVPDVPDEPVEPDVPEKTLTSISATYSGGDVTVGTAVSALTGIVVTAHYSDGSTATVTGYALSGNIAEGENTITVTYEGKTATFVVTGVETAGTVVAMTQKHFGGIPTLYSDNGSTSAQSTTSYGWCSDTIFDQDSTVHVEITLAKTLYRSIKVGSYDSANNTAYYVETAVSGYPEGGKKYEYDYTIKAGYGLGVFGINAVDASNILTVTY